MGKPKSLIEFVADRPARLSLPQWTSAGSQSWLGAACRFGEGLERTVRWYQERQEWWRPLKTGDYWSTTSETTDRLRRPLKRPTTAPIHFMYRGSHCHS